jgi:hypothetical protein
MDLTHGLWDSSYLTYPSDLLGISATKKDKQDLVRLNEWLGQSKRALQAFVASAGSRVLSAKATAILSGDILSLPYPESGDLDLSPNEQIIIDDILDYYRDLIRLGEDSAAIKEGGHEALADFNSVFTRQINTVYRKKPLRALESQTWSGVICQPFVFGNGRVDWSGVDELEGKLNDFLHEQQGTSLLVTRTARLFDGNFVFLLKPDRLRYWLRSVALRDADETLADLRAQGL